MELPSCILSAITKIPARQDKKRNITVFLKLTVNNYLKIIFATTANTCWTASRIRLLIITVYIKKYQASSKERKKNNSLLSDGAFKHKPWQQWSWQPGGGRCCHWTKGGGLAILSMACICQYKKERSDVIVVLNTEICTSCLQFLWVVLFFF